MSIFPLALIIALGFLYGTLPLPLRRIWVSGWTFLLALWGPRREIIRSNLKIAYPKESDANLREQLEYSSYEHLVSLAFEIAMVFVPGRFMLWWIRRNHVLEKGAYETWHGAHQQGKGVLFLSSHVGNWELMAAIGGYRETDLLLVTKKLKPAWFHRALEAGRLRFRVRATYEPRTFRDVLPHLAAGKTVGVVLDQYAGPPVGVRVPLFGVPVGTHQVLAILAKRTGAPVLPVVNYRRADGKQYFRVEPPLKWIEHENPQEELALNTAQYVQVVERHIRECPEQWLWIHRRFKGDLGPLRAMEWREGRIRK